MLQHHLPAVSRITWSVVLFAWRFCPLQMHRSFVIAFMVTSIWQALPKSWTHMKAKSTCNSRTGCVFPEWNTSVSSESSRLWRCISDHWNFMDYIGQGTSSCPLHCPSLPCTAAAPLPTHHPCAQLAWDATQKAPARFCPSLLLQELNVATFSSCLLLLSAPLVSVAHSHSLPNWDPSAPPICSVLFSLFSSTRDSVKPCSFSSLTAHIHPPYRNWFLHPVLLDVPSSHQILYVYSELCSSLSARLTPSSWCHWQLSPM